jgi:site-specific recombinase XerD
MKAKIANNLANFISYLEKQNLANKTIKGYKESLHTFNKDYSNN